MKYFILLSLLIFSNVTLIAQNSVLINPQDSIDLSYAQFGEQDLFISNTSDTDVHVLVFDERTGTSIKGFGIAPKGKVTLSVNKEQILRLTNNTSVKADLTISFVDQKNKTAKTEEYIRFTLHNSSLRSIPLIIPNVMNPNLSPLSNSGVSLAIGQQIFWRRNGENVLILEVDHRIKEGEKVDIAQLIKEFKD
jgi:hypothetical protein